ncbi:hypothetical protein EDB83DRAFT_2456169 [Lactarius deliciosus]|nr:hypothetical protein EDB83DRAFT_2456169 [Lactarius deliciosus]
MTFHARADVDGEQLPLIIHPVLMKYLLEFDIASQPLDYDFGLPTEELYSPAVHPPVHILVLENEQGLTQNIEVQPSGPGIGVTVKDVLNMVGVYLRKSSSQHEWAALGEGTEREVQGPFEDQARTEERSGDLRRIDYLHGRNRLQIFPKHPLPELEDGAGVDGVQLLPHNPKSSAPVTIRLPTFLSRGLRLLSRIASVVGTTDGGTGLRIPGARRGGPSYPVARRGGTPYPVATIPRRWAPRRRREGYLPPSEAQC